MPSRRRFLALGAALPSIPLAAAPADCPPVPAVSFSLNGDWDFRLDAEKTWRTVSVPHTWQVEPANTEYRGVAWYRRDFDAPAAWADAAVRVEFEAVFHTAIVSVNGAEAGRHTGKGYTAFTLDLGQQLRFGARNTLLVRVDNAFNESMLPRGRSSDWAHDGGIYRPVQLLVTPKVFVERVAVDAESGPTAGTHHSRGAKRSGHGLAGPSRFPGAERGRLDSRPCTAPAHRWKSARARLAKSSLESSISKPRLWHFDHPNLYRLTAALSNGHTFETTFGIREDRDPRRRVLSERRARPPDGRGAHGRQQSGVRHGGARANGSITITPT